MPIPPLYGHDQLKLRLSTAIAAGRLPPAMLLSGPPGVGKQRLALWIAQALLCEQQPGSPCDSCPACRMVLGLSHPDVHWFFPIPRPRGDEAKQVEEAEELLAQAIASRREQPLYPRPDGMAGLFLPLVRALHRRARLRPAVARAKVFIVGECERLVPQASSPEAANAMLKVLEEPPADTWFLLTSAEPTALLPTIRSRLVPMRVGRLAADVVERFLTTVPEPPLPAAVARSRAARCGGSIGEALALEDEDQGTRAAARELLEAAHRGPAARYRYALGIKPYQARGDFSAMLSAAAELLRDDLELRLRSGSASDEPAARLVERIRSIEEARRLAQGNVNPQLIIADLLVRLGAG
ncbi:MAG TPA: hypothetical protein VNL98_03015 [Gemmatimonadales bacterium]|nr:hypothetical protein [Gemmatimonadales bacterium]